MKKYIQFFFLLFLLFANIVVFIIFPESKIVFYLFIFESFVFQILIPLYKIIDKSTDIFEPFYFFILLFQSFYFIHTLFICFDGLTISLIKNEFNQAVANRMFFVINLSVISFYMGYFFIHKSLIPNFFVRERKKIEGKYLLHLRWMSMFFVLVGFASFLLIVKGEIFNYLTHLAQRPYYIRGHGFFMSLSYFTPIGIIGLFYSYIEEGRIKIFRYLILVGLIMVYLLEGSRGRAFIVIVAMLILFNYLRKKISFKNIVSFILITLVVVFVFGNLRSFFINKNKPVQKKKEYSKLHKVVRNIFFSGEHTLVPMIKPMEEKPFKTLLGPFVVLIPTSIFPKKQEFSISRVYTDHYFPIKKLIGGTVSPGIIGHVILIFGDFGIPVIFFVLGIVLKILYNHLLKNIDSWKYVLFYSFTVPTFVFIGISRDFITSISLWLFFFVPYILFVTVIKILNKYLIPTEK